MALCGGQGCSTTGGGWVCKRGGCSWERGVEEGMEMWMVLWGTMSGTGSGERWCCDDGRQWMRFLGGMGLQRERRDAGC